MTSSRGKQLFLFYIKFINNEDSLLFETEGAFKRVSKKSGWISINSSAASLLFILRACLALLIKVLHASSLRVPSIPHK